MPDPYCPPPPPPPPLFPPTIILSCTEPYRAPPPLPARSTFCYSTTGKFFSKQELIDDKRRWETFERVENHNSIVREELANTVPAAGIGQTDRVWYQFKDNQERTEFKMGQFAHIAKFPTVTDFIQPYSNRAIPYTSSVLSSIANLPTTTTTDCACERPVIGKTISVDQRLSNIKALNLYVRVSTQTAKYPKSPYRFDSAEEYLLYKRYVSMNNVR